MRPYSLVTLTFAILAQLVERIHGKDEVPSSILGDGSKNKGPYRAFIFAAMYTTNQCYRQLYKSNIVLWR